LQALKLAKFGKITFYKCKNQRKSLTNSLWATVSSPNTEFDVLASPTNLVSTIQIMILRIFKVSFGESQAKNTFASIKISKIW
jgi:hypothetical protein